MNVFGIIIGQNILALGGGVILVLVGMILLRWGWGWKILGLLVFSGSVGWVTSLLLHQDSQVRDGQPLPVVVTFIAALFAAWIAWQEKDSVRQSRGRSAPNRNTIIGGLVVGVVVITAFSYLTSGNVGILNLDDPQAQLAYNQSTDGTKRYINRFLRAIDRELAK